MSRKRTIVGSWPRRRQLRGREAIERALAHARRWGASSIDAEQLWAEGHGVASKASELAYEWRLKHDPQHRAARDGFASWLPDGVCELTTVELERLLAGLPIIGGDGDEVTLDEVAP